MDTEKPNPNGLNSKSYDTFQRNDLTKMGNSNQPSIGLPHNLNMKMTYKLEKRERDKKKRINQLPKEAE